MSTHKTDGYALFNLPNYHDLEKVMMDGYADVDCTECDHAARIEPDGDYPCTECADGRLVSPLIEAGLI